MSNHRLPHNQVPARVTAFVDQGVKDLVEALNGIDEEAWTVDSCQGSGDMPAYVSLRYGRIGAFGAAELARFAERLVAAIRQSMNGDIAPIGYDTRIALEWNGNKKHPCIRLEIPAHELEAITNVFCVAQRSPVGCTESRQPSHRMDSECDV